MKPHRLLSLALCFVAPLCAAEPALPDLANPLMGTDSTGGFSHGNTYPAVAVPWGMNFWSPQTGGNFNGWMYTYKENEGGLRGLVQTHQPSPWINDYAKFSLTPMQGKLIARDMERKFPFKHENETSRPYYYGVTLDNGVKAEVSAANHSAALRFTYPRKDEPAYVVLDVMRGASQVKIDKSKKRITGFVSNNTGGVPANFKNHFVIEFDTPLAGVGTWAGENISEGQTELDKDVPKSEGGAGGYVQFKLTRDNQAVQVNVSSSFISAEQAERNLKEVAGKKFDTVKKLAFEVWDKELNRIKVEGGTEKDRATFYSCLYRALLFPRCLSEYDAAGKPHYYSPYDGKVHEGYMYTDNGFWDTFRAVHPFFTLMYPEVSGRIMQGLVATYEQSGWLPEWMSPGHKGCMIGNNSFSLLADAYFKGVRNFDVEKALEAMLTSATGRHPHIGSVGRDGYQEYWEKGYISTKTHESVAKTLEYAYADWCLARVAEDLGKKDIAEKFYKSSQNFRNVFDPEAADPRMGLKGFMRGRNPDGTWANSPKLDHFDPISWGGHFTEGNSWHYTWSVFHDIQGLIDLMGGDKNFVAKLDGVFASTTDFHTGGYGGVIHEMVEAKALDMGQYGHGNQPIQHMIYLYGHTSEPWKGQKWVREVMERAYKPTPDGYCGDEDNGQTSMWYVMSALGFYSVTPGQPEYVLGSPLFEKITMKMPTGKTFVIEAKKNNAQNVYIQNAALNGKSYTKNYLSHEDFQKGGRFQMEMGAAPNTERGINPADRPFSVTNLKK